MSTLHVVYRLDEPGTRREQWSSYSFPHGIYVGGATLDEVRAEFKAAAAFGLADLGDLVVVEHLERPLAPGAYIRTAVDRRTLDREAAAGLLRGVLQVVDQWRDFQERVPPAATGDSVTIACVPEDRLSWILEQMSDHDAVGICAPGPATGAGQLVWWSSVLGSSAAGTDSEDVETFAALGLDGGSTVSELMRVTASSTGHRLALAG